MNSLFILDKDSKTEISEDLRTKVCRILTAKGHQVEIAELETNKISPCLGLDCFHCVTQHPQECINKDAVYPLKKNIGKYDLAVFLAPVIFGHYRSCVKNAIDRGAGSHNWQVFIGYGSDIDDEEKSTFIDLIAKHMGSNDIVHPGMNTQVNVYVTRSIEDNSAICESLLNAY
jgi:multimeric flavodoxin WrbA